MTFDTEKDTHVSGTFDLDLGRYTPHSSRPPAHSKSSLRAQAIEEEAALVCLETILTAKTAHEAELRTLETVFGTGKFEHLPLHRKRYVEGYRDGAEDALRRQSRHAPTGQLRVPPKIRALQPDAVWHHHPNGGGWVAHTAYVAATAYVGPTAAVYDRARVTEAARVYGEARVCDDADLSGFVRVKAKAVVGGEAVLSGRVTVAGDFKVFGRVRARGTETLKDEADVLRTTFGDDGDAEWYSKLHARAG